MFGGVVEAVKDLWAVRGGAEFELYGDRDNGYVVEYGENPRRTRALDSGREVVEFYNLCIRPVQDRDPVGVAGTVNEPAQRLLSRRSGTWGRTLEGGWAVDVYDAALDYAPTARERVREAARPDHEMFTRDYEDDTVQRGAQFLENMLMSFGMYAVDPIDRFETHVTDAIAARHLQAVTAAETGEDVGDDFPAFLDEVERLRDGL